MGSVYEHIHSSEDILVPQNINHRRPHPLEWQEGLLRNKHRKVAEVGGLFVPFPTAFAGLMIALASGPATSALQIVFPHMISWADSRFRSNQTIRGSTVMKIAARAGTEQEDPIKTLFESHF